MGGPHRAARRVRRVRPLQEHRSTGSAATSPRTYAEAAARAFDPEALTIGFARRLATYKRLHLLVQDAERALAMLSGDRPVQLVIAGKAHPRDDEGKRLVQHLFTFKWAPEVGGRVVYLDDYDLSSAARMVRGCDVWVNLPRPPLEASGTSGMKSAVNGGLQLSVLDGWWAEGYDGTNGWALNGDEDADHGAQDHRDGVELHRLLEEEVAREFYERDADGLPRAWLAAGQELAGHERPGVLGHAHGPGLRQAVLQRRRAPVARDAAPRVSRAARPRRGRRCRAARRARAGAAPARSPRPARGSSPSIASASRAWPALS